MADEYTGGISGYQVEAWRTGSSADDPTDVGASLMRNLALAGMGLAGESGEVCDLLKEVVAVPVALAHAECSRVVLDGARHRLLGAVEAALAATGGAR